MRCSSPAALLTAVMLLTLPLALAQAEGRHGGEADRIQVAVEFHQPSLWTTTDANGTYFVFAWGTTVFEPKIYAPAYWGTFPGYFLGETMRFTVTVTNSAPKGAKPLNVRVQALSSVLNVDGSFGTTIGEQQEWQVERLRPGESRSLAGQVAIVGTDLPSGLDVTRLRIAHTNAGKNADAGLIKEVLAVWCPPGVESVSAPSASN